jgi:hypothetical protein
VAPVFVCLVFHLLHRPGELEQHGYEHEARPVRAGHDERPRRQVPEADPHPDPARVLALDQLVRSEEDECSGSGVLER